MDCGKGCLCPRVEIEMDLVCLRSGQRLEVVAENGDG